MFPHDAVDNALNNLVHFFQHQGTEGIVSKLGEMLVLVTVYRLTQRWLVTITPIVSVRVHKTMHCIMQIKK